MKPLILLAAIIFVPATVTSAAEVYAPLDAEPAKRAVLDWAKSRGVLTATVRKSLGELWANADHSTAPEILSLSVRSAELIDPAIRKFAKHVRSISRSAETSLDAFDELKLNHPFAKNNLRAWFGQRLTRERHYEDALDVLGDVDAARLVDPATFLFHKAVCEQQLLKFKEAFATLDALLRKTEKVPARYETLARLMQHQLNAINGKAPKQILEQISQRMKNGGVKLHQGRAGSRVQKLQEKIIADLDDLIERLEQPPGDGPGPRGPPGPPRPNPNPAGNPYDGGISGPGNTTPRDFTDRDIWGNLPEKEKVRQENIINRQLPPHYRDRIERYAKRCAAQWRASQER